MELITITAYNPRTGRDQVKAAFQLEQMSPNMKWRLYDQFAKMSSLHDTRQAAVNEAHAIADMYRV